LTPYGTHAEEAQLNRATTLLAGSLLAVAVPVAGAYPSHAEPLAPLTPAETQYLEQLHRVFAASHDPIAFRNDGELLDRGRYVCSFRDLGFGGQPATQQTPAINQLALIYLCPQ
jgi:hypothetical protein